jgi:hypothetical protein
MSPVTSPVCRDDRSLQRVEHVAPWTAVVGQRDDRSAHRAHEDGERTTPDQDARNEVDATSGALASPPVLAAPHGARFARPLNEP